MRSVAVRSVLLTCALAGVVVPAVLLRESPSAYVITAIDYHFHDAHPTLPIAQGRDVVVKNAGRNPHNVTIPEMGIATDLAPGEEFTIEDVAGRFAPGRYVFVCRFHEDRGMTGVIVLVGS